MKLPNKLRQLVLLFQNVRMRGLLTNRITIVAVIFLLLGFGVSGYVSANDDGTVEGVVLDELGNPVQNATVTIEPVGIRNQGQKAETTTNGDGRFTFTGRTELLEFRISAQKPGVGSSPVERHHLHFKGQNKEVTIVIS